jgi:hypothetical protein
VGVVQPFAAVLLLALMFTEEWQGSDWVIIAHVFVFAVTARMLLGVLAADRPAAEQFTGFFSWVVLGAAAGALFNMVAAPLLFRSVVEYPLMLVLACLLRPAWWAAGVRTAWRWRRVGLDLLLPAGFAALTIVLLWLAPTVWPLALGLCLLLVARPVRFGLGLGAVLLSHALSPGQDRVPTEPDIAYLIRENDNDYAGWLGTTYYHYKVVPAGWVSGKPGQFDWSALGYWWSFDYCPPRGLSDTLRWWAGAWPKADEPPYRVIYTGRGWGWAGEFPFCKFDSRRCHFPVAFEHVGLPIEGGFYEIDERVRSRSAGSLAGRLRFLDFRGPENPE